MMSAALYRTALSFVAVVLGLAPCALHAQDAPQAPDSAATDSTAVVRKPTVAITPFFIEGVEDTFFTATVEVPEDRAKPDGRRIPLHVVIVPPLEKKAGLPPLFDIAGGPGVAATRSAPEYAAAWRMRREKRAVVLVDQRGTGQSGALQCPNLEPASRLEDGYDPGAVRRCRDELAQTADLSRYRTIDAVRDIEDVRNALAYDQIDMIGADYGTQVVQMYMREYPQNVHAAVMLGAVPLGERITLHQAANAEEILQRVLDDCDSDPDCGRAFPSLRREWSELLERLDAAPVRAEYYDSTGARGVEIRRGPFGEALRSLLDDTGMQRRVPLVIHEAAQDNFQPFLDLVFTQADSAIAQGLYLCVTCPEGATRIAADEIGPATDRTFAGRRGVDRQVEACAAWGLAPVSDEELAPVSSTVPTLLLSGGMDAVTPVAWSQEVSSRLTNSLVLVIDHLGHHPGSLENMECLETVIAEFFAKVSVIGLDTGCFATMTPPPFVTE